MPRYQRYDIDGASEAELTRRWNAFHRAVRATTSGRVAQLLAPLLGEDTARRRLAQSLLQRTAVSTTSLNVTTTNVTVRDLDSLRPTVHRPATAAVSATAIITVTPDALDATFHAIEVALAGSAEWLLLVGPTHAADGGRVLAALWPSTPHGDVVFADEDAASGPVFKTAAVGPHTLYSANVVGRPTMIRTSVIRDSGGVRPEAGVAFEWDLLLRLRERGATFFHVPMLLPDLGGDALATHHDYGESSCRVVRDAWCRSGHDATVWPGPFTGSVHWRIAPPAWPLVDIIIPTRDRVDLVRRCIDSIEATTTYPTYRITILDNDSTDQSTLDYFAYSDHSVVACPGPFNYAAIMNRGVAATTAPLIVTLNNDTVIDTPDWLEQLVEVTLLDQVGLVGCRNTDPDGGHDHDGVIIAPYPQHLRGGVNWQLHSHFTDLTRDITAVTGAVCMIRREAWDAVTGMDETLAVVMNDIDLCLRLQNEGWTVMIVPSVQIIHFTSSSRGRLDPLSDRNRFVRRWDIFGSFCDPYFPEALQLFGSTIVAQPSLDFGVSKENK